MHFLFKDLLMVYMLAPLTQQPIVWENCEVMYKVGLHRPIYFSPDVSTLDEPCSVVLLTILRVYSQVHT